MRNVRFAGLAELPGMSALTKKVNVLKLQDILALGVTGELAKQETRLGQSSGGIRQSSCSHRNFLHFSVTGTRCFGVFPGTSISHEVCSCRVSSRICFRNINFGEDQSLGRVKEDRWRGFPARPSLGQARVTR